MSSFCFKNIAITGVASAVPANVVKSTDFSDVFGEEAIQKFVSMTGVRERRVSSKYQTASDLGYIAAEKLITEKRIDRNSIGILVFGSLSDDYRRPSTACVLHKRLNLANDCAAFDVGLGCSAFVYCVQIAAAMLQCTEAQRALVIVGETMSKLTYVEDKSTSMLFGDAGAAVLIEKKNDRNGIMGELCTDGSGYRTIIVPAGGFRNLHDSCEPMLWDDGNKRTLYNTYMNGTDVFSFTVTKVPKTIKSFLNKTNQELESFDCLAFHQANQLIHQQLAKKLKANKEKMPLCIEKYGNTSAPAIPLVLSHKYGTSQDDKLINVLMCGFGVGLSWGVLSTTILTQDIFPVVETDDFFDDGIIRAPEDLQK